MKKTSNKERIQNMTTEELAEFLLQVDDICLNTCKAATGNKYKCPYADEGCNDLTEQCVQCYMKYLESEVDAE